MEFLCISTGPLFKRRQTQKQLRLISISITRFAIMFDTAKKICHPKIQKQKLANIPTTVQLCLPLNSNFDVIFVHFRQKLILIEKDGKAHGFKRNFFVAFVPHAIRSLFQWNPCKSILEKHFAHFHTEAHNKRTNKKEQTKHNAYT